MSKFNITLRDNNSNFTESSIKSILVDALEQAGYSEESWQHEGEYFYGDFSVEVSEE